MAPSLVFHTAFKFSGFSGRFWVWFGPKHFVCVLGARLERDAEAVVDLLELLPGRVADAAPCAQELLVAALQARDGLPGARLEALVLVEPLLRCPGARHTV